MIVTTGSSAGFILAFLALFEPGDRVAVAVPGYPPYRHILKALGCEPVLIETTAATRWAITPDMLHRRAPPHAARGRAGRQPRQSDRHHDDARGAAALIEAAEGEGIRFISDEIYHGLDYAFPAVTAAGLSGNVVIINSFSKYFCMTGWRVGWMVVPEPLVRPIDRLQGNLAISVPTLSQIAAEAAFDGRAEMEAVKHGYEENRRILVDELPKAGLDTFLPVDGAFYLYADVSRFSNDSFDFAKRMLEETHVAATPGVDFDPLHGTSFIRFCYAGSAAEMHEAVERIGTWLLHESVEDHARELLQSCVAEALAGGYASRRLDKECQGRDAMTASSNLRAPVLALLVACAAWTSPTACRGTGQLPGQADPPDRSAGARQRHRSVGAFGVGGGRNLPQPEDHRREQAGRRLHHRARSGGEGRARRLHARHGPGRGACDQPEHDREDALRHPARLPAGRAADARASAACGVAEIRHPFGARS